MLDIIKKIFWLRKINITVYKRSNGYFMHPNKISTDGVWLAVEPCINLKSSASYKDIGIAIKYLMPYCNGVIAHPSDFTGLFKFILDKANVTSYAKFMHGCNGCGIFVKGKNLVIRPYENDRNKGFSHSVGVDVIFPRNSSDSIYGKKLIECIGSK